MLITSAQLKTVLDENFADIRSTSILLFVRDLLERVRHGGGIEQYRLVNKKTNAKITTVDEFIAAIDTDSLKMSYYRFAEKMGGDRIHPFAVIPENIEVQLDQNAPEDGNYTSAYGMTANKVMFLINYLSDADPTLPLKIFDIKLV